MNLSIVKNFGVEYTHRIIEVHYFLLLKNDTSTGKPIEGPGPLDIYENKHFGHLSLIIHSKTKHGRLYWRMKKVRR